MSLPETLASFPELAGELLHLEEALTHPSFANEQRGPCVDNQRLELLGDAVLGLCATEIVMKALPDADEGRLSLLRAGLVNADALATWARGVGLGSALRLGRGADAAGERDQKNVLADAVEALVGCVYLDRGLDAARSLTSRIVGERLAVLVAQPGGRDAKSELQERVQATGGAAPRYRVVAAEGPEHSREFTVVVEVAGAVIGEGKGRSKKIAEQAAARAALDALSSRAPS